MLTYLLKLSVLVLFSFVIMFYYYFKFSGHLPNFDGYTFYILILIIVYGIYKYVQSQGMTEKIVFTPLIIVGFFLSHLLILSGLYFYYTGVLFTSGILLFFKILFYSFLPLLIVFCSLGFGKKIATLLFEGIGENDYLKENKICTFIISLGLGFTSFIFLLGIVGMLGFYNLYSVFGILAIFITFSYQQISEFFDGILNYKIVFGRSIGAQINLVSAEFFFIIITLILSVNLISVVRPFPIGWDDLGVYMNFPHLMAEAGSILNLGGMFSWQTLTGIGYMFGSPVQAFFLNNIGGFLSVITLILITSDLLKSKIRETYINIPMLLAMLFISMPMIVFEQAKDMKLDPGLFFISISAVYLLFKSIILKSNNLLPLKSKGVLDEGEGGILKNSSKSFLVLLFFVGILSGFAFTIKFTSLLLISAIFGVLFYARLGLLGLFGYFAIFVSIFTKGNLWKFMNVVYPHENLTFINTFSLSAFLLGGVLFTLLYVKNVQSFNKALQDILIFTLGVLIVILPWVTKNIYESYPNISIGSIISGKTDRFVIDYSNIHSSEQLELLENTKIQERMSSSGITTNEDFGRYFGYEKGINNYLKLPWNLTMQSNQGGEFTNIGYIFLAFVPGLFLFLPYRRKYFSIGVGIILLLELSIFLVPGINGIFTNIFNGFSLPGGYSVILTFFLLPLLYFLYGLKDTPKNNLFKLNLVFSTLYVFLWTISAFGIVWYGIVMYFNLLLAIGLGLYYLSGYNREEKEKGDEVKFFGSVIIFLIILVYVFNSVFPYTFNNLKNAGYPEYKLGTQTTAEAPYVYHTEYLPIIFELNIAESKKGDFLASVIQEDTKKALPGIENQQIELITAYLKKIVTDKNMLSRNAKISLEKLYAGISNPEKEFRNKEIIYRVGTFLKYHISENNKRIFEDALLTNFDTYMHSDNVHKTVQNIKNTGISYLLVDLNAATIDNDPRHDLTRRYENMLKTFTSEQLELVETDSVCLKVGLENYKNSQKEPDDFQLYMSLAGVNYESYPEDRKIIPRNLKRLECYKFIDTLITSNKIDSENYSYLLNYVNYIQSKQSQFNSEESRIKLLASQINGGFKVLFKIK